MFYLKNLGEIPGLDPIQSALIHSLREQLGRALKGEYCAFTLNSRLQTNISQGPFYDHPLRRELLKIEGQIKLLLHEEKEVF